MRSYYGEAVKVNVNGVAGFEICRVEMWTENNHSTIYSGVDCVYDGYHSSKKFRDEVERICDNARNLGFEPEVVRL